MNELLRDKNGRIVPQYYDRHVGEYKPVSIRNVDRVNVKDTFVIVDMYDQVYPHQYLDPDGVWYVYRTVDLPQGTSVYPNTISKIIVERIGTPIPGPQGPQGPQGTPGPIGPIGPQPDLIDSITSDSIIAAPTARAVKELNEKLEFGIEQISEEKADLSYVEKQLEYTTSVLVSKYNLKLDGTDSLADIQYAFDDLKALGYSSIKFPPNATLHLRGSLLISLEVDFNNAVVTAPLNIPAAPIKLKNGAKLKNLTLKQLNHNYTSNAHGIEYTEAENIDNLFLTNVSTEGFHVGINIFPEDGYLASNVRLTNCKSTYAKTYGTDISNSYDVVVANHIGKNCRTDGFKTTRNTRKLRMYGGNFSYNVHPTETYADGIDFYAGASDVLVSGAVCEYNGGVGIHILSGELNDPNYRFPPYAPIQDIIVENCICNNNESAGIDALTKTSVSPTSPKPRSILIDKCTVLENGNGINSTSTHLTINQSIIKNNKMWGIQLSNCDYVELNNTQLLYNSQASPDTYSGLNLNGCRYVKVNGGIIDGLNPDTSVVTHKYAINIAGVMDSNDIEINGPIMVNFNNTRAVYVNGFTDSAFADRIIVVKQGDIKTKPLNNQIGSYGSELIRNGVKYVKRTNLNSVEWSAL